ncbi:SubName: Full=Uncharacterized protein {ECO:0000313/EMBL:KIM31660.1} [Serendipita indica DSM 11827]|nr:SubName: Full=Uncharacterized protein {ECO:0000313/EMBL:KIM31660.1} [Serendipita indica DSM 11827]
MSEGFAPWPQALAGQSSEQCYIPTVPSQGGLYTTYTITCADHPSSPGPSSPMDRKALSPTLSQSGSSAGNSSVDHEEELIVETSQINPQYTQQFSEEPSHIEYCSLVDTPPIYSLRSSIGYGIARIIFIEKLIWNCALQIYGIYGAPTTREPGPTSSISLEVLVQTGLVHGLCNEIVILPIMAAIQKGPGSMSNQADMIPFPMFMAEMLRRMKASYFLLQTAMRYVLDIESQIRSTRERAACGWCRSGIFGCDHSTYAEPSSSSRFSRGRISNGKQLRQDLTSVPTSTFTKFDPLYPLVDPRKAFLGALILANKFHRDRSIGNKSWASLIGLPLEEVHSAERAVGSALGWTLSRPWVQEAKENGTWVPGSLDPTFSEPLFATNEQEVARYGVKALRDCKQLPPPIRLDQLSSETQFAPPLTSSIETDGEVTPDATPRRPRSRTLTSADSRPIVPLPARQQTIDTQPVRKANPLRKAATAPFVLQPNATASQQMSPEFLWSETPCKSTTSSFDTFTDTTPTLEPTRSKRKASQDYGHISLLRRGFSGQRLPVQSPSDSDLPSPSPSHASCSSHSSSVGTGAATRTRQIRQRSVISESGDDTCPELSPSTRSSTSPSVGLLTRTNTPGSLDAVMMMDDVHQSQPTYAASRSFAIHYAGAPIHRLDQSKSSDAPVSSLAIRI